MKSIEYRLPLREELPRIWLQKGAGEGSEQGSLLLHREEGVAAEPTGVPLTLPASITEPGTLVGFHADRGYRNSGQWKETHTSPQAFTLVLLPVSPASPSPPALTEEICSIPRL